MPQFRINARNIFLTYPRCHSTKEELLEYLKGFDISYAVISKETHQDGTPHLHAVIGFDKKRDFRNDRVFDFGVHHPNIQSCRNLNQSIEYVKKDGDFIEYGNVPRKRQQTDYGSIIDSSTSSRDFLVRLKDASPRSLVRNFNAVSNFADQWFKKVESPYESPYTLANFPFCPDAVLEWISGNLTRPQPQRPRSLFLIGPSRTGKTQLARCLSRHMYFCNYVDFKSGWDEQAEYAVFDDIAWEHQPCKKFFAGCQESGVITDKYMAKRSVLWGKPSIFLMNQLPNFDDYPWYQTNCEIVNIINKLY